MDQLLKHEGEPIELYGIDLPCIKLKNDLERHLIVDNKKQELRNQHKQLQLLCNS